MMPRDDARSRSPSAPFAGTQQSRRTLTQAVVLQLSGEVAAARRQWRAIALDRLSPIGRRASADVRAASTVLSAGASPRRCFALSRVALGRLPIPSTQVPVRIDMRVRGCGRPITRRSSEVDAALAIDPRSISAKQLRAQIGRSTP